MIMFINFGSFSKKLKTYRNSDLGISEEYKDVEFILYQKVSYLYIIPFVPLHKYWKVIDKNTKKEISVNDETYKKLNRFKDRIKSPLWTYTGGCMISVPIILIIGFLVYLLFSSFFSEVSRSIDKEMKSRNNRENIENLNEETFTKIENLSIGDVYYFKAIEMIMKKDVKGKKLGFKKSDRETFQYKVTAINGQEITFQLMSQVEDSEIEVTFKNTVILTKEQVIAVTDTYKHLPLYEGIKDASGENAAEAVFAIDRIVK